MDRRRRPQYPRGSAADDDLFPKPYASSYYRQDADDMVPSPGFSETYKCYSVAMLSGPAREGVDEGGKIIMPPSALTSLTRLNVQYPMLFKLTNKRIARDTHCGVLEFVADEGRIYLPHWMMRNLLLEEEDSVQLDSISLQIAKYAQFQPQSQDFLDISNPKAVLESALRKFACLTVGDMVAINYNEKVYELCVLKVEPGNAASIIECDLNVEFAPPVGYVEPERVPQRQASTEEPTPVDVSDYIRSSQFRAFSGQGVRLDGKTKKTVTQEQDILPSDIKRGIPDYDHKGGSLKFIRSKKLQKVTDDKDKDSFAKFSGSGQCLRDKDSRK